MGKGKIENLKPFSKDYQPKKNGRKKSKLKGFIQDNDLSALDVQNLAKMVLDKKEIELKEIIDDKENPMLARLFVRLYLEDWKTGRFDNLGKILERAIGTVKDRVELSTLDEEGNEKGIEITVKRAKAD